MLIVMTTTPYLHQAEALAAKIVEGKLGACVQILAPVTSLYVWKGKVRKDKEHLMLIKTLPEKYDELAAFITEHSSYEVPEIVAIDAEKVSEPYLEWMKGVIDL